MTRNDTLLFRLLLGALAVLALLCLPLLLDEGEVPEALDDEGPIGKITSLEELLPPDATAPEEAGEEVNREARRDAAVEPTFATGPRRRGTRTLRGVVHHAITEQPLPGIYFAVEVSRPWVEIERTTVLHTDGEGRFELSRCPRGSSLTFGEVTVPEVHGYQVFELEPRTIRIEDVGELVLRAHPPALVLHLSAQRPDGGAIAEPSFWVQTEAGRSPAHEPLRHRLEGNRDPIREVLTASFLPSELSSDFLMVGIEKEPIPRVEIADPEDDEARVIWGESIELGGEWTWERGDSSRIRSRAREDPRYLVAGPVQIGDWRGEHHHTFDLQPGGKLTVLVLDVERETAEGVLVRIEGDVWRDSWPYRRTRYTGVQNFESLKPGLHDVVVLDSFGPAVELARESVTVNSDETTELVIELPAERRLAVSGTLESANGRPMTQIKLRVSIDGQEARILSTDGDGHFEVWTRFEANQLAVRPIGELWGGRFEPAIIECPFGATDLRFTRVEESVARFRLYFTDEQTGAPIRGFRHVTLHVEGATSARHGSWFVLPNEPHDEPFLSAPYTPRDDLRWIARVPHYRTERGNIPAPAQRGEIVEITVPLTRGFRDELRVISAHSGMPIAGAKITDDRGQELGCTDGGGRVTLSADDWPTGLRVEAPGFLPVTGPLDRQALTTSWDGEIRLQAK